MGGDGGQGIAAFLRRDSPFRDLPSADLEQLAASLRPHRYAPGEALVRQGESGDDAFLIREGELDVVRATSDGEHVLARLGAGALIGEIAVLTGSGRTATVRARTDVEALVAPGDEVRAIVKRHRALVGRLGSVMQARHTPRPLGQPDLERAPDDPDAVILYDRARGAYVRLDRQALAIYRDLDGERTLRELAMRHLERSGSLDPVAVFSTVAALQAAGFASLPRIATDAPDGRMLRVLDAVLAPRAELRDADPIATRVHRLAAPLFSRHGAVVAVIAGIGGLAAAIPHLRAASPTDFGAIGLLVAFVGLLVAGIGHEVAHALAAKAEGCRLGRAGIGLFWFAPVVYVDTSATWAIPRWGRVRVNTAGPLFNLALGGALGLATLIVGGAARDLLVWLALTNVVLVVFNLSPLLEFDGYYVLADLTDTNALRRKALRFVFRDMLAPRPRRWSRREAGFLAYTVAAAIYVLGMSAFVLSNVPQVVSAVLPLADGAVRASIGVALAALLSVLLVAPFVLEALDARSRVEPGMA